ncbi:MAG TPA: dihydroxyacetone kinase subunit L [Methylophaga aminisulfidivorans]|uniref:Dihydroxyacetone kinase subunit L n=1 Tax=Methylophaga aminisulfidivorans TaxID=230105 RepID=A0A7C1ZVW1_9GAMM|nr:dihydroxyacetone kinase subunit L [Methylophaga aminisulfidivorans]
MLDTNVLPTIFKAIKLDILANEAEVAALDRAIGDGDHVSNLLRGITALEALNDELIEMNWSNAFSKIGMTLMSTMGGASGSLFGSMFVSMGKAAKEQEMNMGGAIELFAIGVDSIKQRGKADVGEKTMLDSLIPAVTSLRNDLTNQSDKEVLLENMKQAATKGMLSTEDMLATKGRASFLGERARGHIDAGARTSQLMLCTIADILKN